MNRKIYHWKLREAELQLGIRTLIMGVLNVTPDSFSDGGRFNDPDRAYARALELEEQGADIIDIGAESTKPGSQRISADEEWQRLVPILKRLREGLTVPLSLDTYKSEIAERALQYGIQIFNDPSGLTFDPDMAKVAAHSNAGLILNHMRGQPETWGRLSPMQDPMGTIVKDLDATISRARHAGVDRGKIVVDPGLGFGKRKEQNAEILAHLSRLAEMEYPILVGPSRKSFLAQPSDDETLYATAAAVTACVLNGAHIVRVHDVKEMRAAVQVAEEIARAAAAEETPKEERPATRAHTGPEVREERPRPPRPPLSRPPAPPVAEQSAMSEREEVRPEREQRDRPYPPRRDESERPRRDGAEPPRRTFRPAAAGDRPPRKEYRTGSSDRPPRREFGAGPSDRPPRKEYRTGSSDRPPRKEFGTGSSDRPPRKEFRPGSGDRPPRREFGTGPSDRPPRKEFRPGSRPDGKPSGFKPPGFKPPGFKPSGFKRSGPPRSFEGGPGRDAGRRDDRPPRKTGDRPEGGSRPPKRPFRKRP